MTKAQAQQRRMATPKRTAAQVAQRERYLLTELARIGWRVTPTGPYQLFLQKAG